MACPGDWTTWEINFGSAWYGPWDVEQQRQNQAMAESLTTDFLETVAGTIWEPADWGIALMDGFQWYDSVGMLPLIPASFGDNLGRFVSRYGDEFVLAIRQTDDLAPMAYRSFTYVNLRENLARLTGFLPTNAFQAHHILPNKFRREFELAGFVGDNSIHHPQFGTWVNAAEHQGWTRAYQDRWTAFFEQHDNPTMEQILDFAKILADEYGFDVYFP